MSINHETDKANSQIDISQMPPYPHTQGDTVVPPPEHRDDKDKKNRRGRNIAVGAVATLVVGGGIGGTAYALGHNSEKSATTTEPSATSEAPATNTAAEELTSTSVAIVDPTTGKMTFSETSPSATTAPEKSGNSPYFIESNDPQDILAQWCGNFGKLANTDHHLSASKVDDATIDSVYNLLVSDEADSTTGTWAKESLTGFLMGASNPALFDNNVNYGCTSASNMKITQGTGNSPEEFAVTALVTESLHTGGYDKLKTLSDHEPIDFVLKKEPAAYDGQSGQTWKLVKALPSTSS